jgi:hypothetical protein
MKAIEIFWNQEIDVRKVEITPAYTWLVDENETIDLTMCAKGASNQRVKADEFTSLMAYGGQIRRI